MAAATLEVVIAGGGFTVIVTVAIFVESETEVAVTVAVMVEAPLVGATYETEVAVALVSVPPPFTVHITPAFLESFAMLAEMARLWLWSMAFVVGVTETEIVCGAGVLAPPPHATKESRKAKAMAGTHTKRCSFIRVISVDSSRTEPRPK